MSLPGWVLNRESSLVQIKEVRLVNKKIKPSVFDFHSGGIRKYLLDTKVIPVRLKASLYRVINFYSLSYDTTNNWWLEVSGVYLQPDPKSSRACFIFFKMYLEIKRRLMAQ